MLHVNGFDAKHSLIFAIEGENDPPTRWPGGILCPRRCIGIGGDRILGILYYKATGSSSLLCFGQQIVSLAGRARHTNTANQPYRTLIRLSGKTDWN